VLNEVGGNKLRNKFLVRLEFEAAEVKKPEEKDLFLDVGKRPSSGDYSKLITDAYNLNVELCDLRGNLFVYKPMLGQQTTIRYVTARSIQDHTYIDVVKRR
jgi:hypothetical protein